MVEGAGKVIFAVARVAACEELDLIERDGTRASHLRRRVRRRELHLISVVVAEFEQRGPDDETRGTLHEPPPIGAATKFAVGHHFQADLFLHAHGFADALVLDARELII